MLNTLIGKQGIDKASHIFYALRIEEVILEESHLSLLIRIVGDSFAEYSGNAIYFKKIPSESTRILRFKKILQVEIHEL